MNLDAPSLVYFQSIVNLDEGKMLKFSRNFVFCGEKHLVIIGENEIFGDVWVDAVAAKLIEQCRVFSGGGLPGAISDELSAPQSGSEVGAARLSHSGGYCHP